MMRFLQALLNRGFDFIVPRHCSFCRAYDRTASPLCTNCFLLIKHTLSVELPVGSYQLKVYGVSGYEEPLKSLIREKNRGDYEASLHMARLIWSFTPLSKFLGDYLIPVPLFSQRLAQRGFNHAQVMAQQISVLSAIEVLECASRIKNTQQQFELSRTDRFENLKNAFVAESSMNAIAGKDIVIVDDMMHSGATLISLAHLLAQYHPKSIRAVVACIMY